MEFNTSFASTSDRYSDISKSYAAQASPIARRAQPKTLPIGDLFKSVLSATLPHIPGCLGPLNLDKRGALYLDQKRWQIALADQELITLELALEYSSECHRRIGRIAAFLQCSSTLLDASNSAALSTQELKEPIRAVLQSFMEEFSQHVQQKLHSGLHGLCELLKFLSERRKQLDAFYPAYERLLSSDFIGFKQICSFWHDFLQSFNFWTINDVPAWKGELFEAFVRLLCRYFEQLIFASTKFPHGSAKIEFIEQILVDDRTIGEKLALCVRCVCSMPKEVKEELEAFSFYNCYQREKERLLKHYESLMSQFTQNFLVRFSSRALSELIIRLNGIVLKELFLDNKMILHLQRMNDFYALNWSSLRKMQINNLCLPPFQNLHRNCSAPAEEEQIEWGQVEAEIAKKLECDSDGHSNGNFFFEKQHWSIGVLFNREFYQHTDRIFLRLYKLVYTLNRLVNEWESGPHTKPMNWTLKMRIRQNLFFQLAQQIQVFVQILWSQFTSLNSFYIAKLTKSTINGSDACLKRVIQTTNEWSETFGCLNEALNKPSFKEPVEELEAIVNELTPNQLIGKENATTEDYDEDEDIEVRSFIEFMNRLQRIRLFIANAEPLDAKRLGNLHKMWNEDGTPPQAMDPISFGKDAHTALNLVFVHLNVCLFSSQINNKMMS